MLFAHQSLTSLKRPPSPPNLLGALKDEVHMKSVSTYLLLTAGAYLFLSAPAFPQAADNTARNKNQATTADDQGTSPADIDLAKKIRKSVSDDKTLSTYAHNVKIIVNNGAVTLRGPVRTEVEKKAVESKAAALAGSAKVTNDLSISPDK